jgi:hypothetical protein
MGLYACYDNSEDYGSHQWDKNLVDYHFGSSYSDMHWFMAFGHALSQEGPMAGGSLIYLKRHYEMKEYKNPNRKKALEWVELTQHRNQEINFILDEIRIPSNAERREILKKIKNH